MKTTKTTKREQNRRTQITADESVLLSKGR